MKDSKRVQFYDWTCEPPYTTDPKYCGKLRCGKHQKVLLNGEDSGNVRKCVTGFYVGWVEKNVIDSEGNTQVVNDEILTEKIYGKVEYICDEQ